MFNLLINLSKMRKKINVLQLIACAMLVAVAVIVSCSVSSCGKMPWDKKSPTLEETVDSLVNAKVKQTVNPIFYSVDEVLVYQDLTNDGNKIDSAFSVMPEDVLKNVSHVLLKKYGTVTKKDIVTEYHNHMDIYPNLMPIQKATDNDSTQATNKGGSKNKKSGVFSTTYKYRTDTVEGVPVKVQIKEEQSYVTD